MTRRSFWKVTVWGLVFTGLFSIIALAADVPMITKETLKSMLGNPEVIIIDIRLDEHLNKSDRKIPGAVIESIFTVKNWAPKYPKDKTLVLYCA